MEAKEVPILFSTPMVKAILDGQKTQTRRIINPQPFIDEDSGYVYFNKHKYAFDIHKWRAECTIAAKWKIGDILWVRETWSYYNLSPEEREGKYLYRANNNDVVLKWKPSLFMPKSACRIWLKITDVKIERIRDISEADAVSEGIDLAPGWGQCQAAYKSLWESINGTGSWDRNPWVWVISFKRIKN